MSGRRRGGRSGPGRGGGRHPASPDSNHNNTSSSSAAPRGGRTNNHNNSGRGRKNNNASRRRQDDGTTPATGHRHHNTAPLNAGAAATPTTTTTQMKDEEVLIAFLPHLKSGNAQALQIHELYQNHHQDEQLFLQQARAFLSEPSKETVPPTASPLTATFTSAPAESKNPWTSNHPYSHIHNVAATVPEPPGAATTTSSTLAAATPPRTPPFNNLQPSSNPFSENNTPTWSTPNVTSLQSTPPRSATLLVTPQNNNNNNSIPPTPATTKKDVPPPKRLWTRVEEQPGILRVEGISGHDTSIVLTLAPRQELLAHWSLPLAFLQQSSENLEQALNKYTIGLFRRGCTENGSQASIISKAVLGDEHRSYDYWKEGNMVCGRVPFYSPRTPGHVVFRMYNEKEPLYTLATGPSLHVRVREEDYESTIRFILSNFKGKKSNPTSLSSLLSLALVLETPLLRPNDSSARATWGCIQEARKVIDACFSEYAKTNQKMSELETAVEQLKLQVEDEGDEQDSKSQALSMGSEIRSTDGGGIESEMATELREKTKTLMSGKASCERKWRDSQLAFASILRAVVTNPTMPNLLRRDLMIKMQIEYELWCPLSEEFAIPGSGGSENNSTLWYEAMRDLPNPITAEDFAAYRQARIKMQQRTLSFTPNTMGVDDVLFPRNMSTPEQRPMDPGAVSLFNGLSAAMGSYYHELFTDEDSIVRKRELIRLRVEQLVFESGAFPVNSKVVIFGSSANGFGSPKSDIDMCLQLPEGSTLNEGDISGAEAMAKLATKLEESGMKGVDTCRLTARIPILMFQCPNPLTGDVDDLIDCDLSMQNPLAVLNTSYLRCYAEITPITRVLAAIIKRWAKARDINNPAKHTLSSYGYIIMLLHFLTYHKRTGNGLVSPVAPVDGNADIRRQQEPGPTPLLPNFHWMDPRWPGSPPGTPYTEVPTLPRNIIKHPLVEDKVVNTYFSRPVTQEQRAYLQVQFSGQDLSLGILLASFFRYFAYEFNYKRHVVSLHSTASLGVVEREVKAEFDGWRNYSAALTIEDPFETFYDVAHVLRGGYYHRIRREFAVAYSKIADAASGRPGSWGKGDLRQMSGAELIDWLCEPVSTESD
ncbi:terminal uridylyltransferase [Fistulifera solaris]|uniref:Terminal uridylyltransferase n=1 Tax=Fistulifera solaris TaxID=1519565 RepID=A0A1Z5JW68_FISSO|nr:terminal uridylyltransferase [Fistulifera solaris]|eukprot:GAX18285.1 terminal uridylyltransferase [Fistulifera solaris]